MVSNLKYYRVIYCSILTLENVGFVVIYQGIFITLAPGACTIKLFTAVIYRFL
jgi:hypothetical protein